LIQQDFGNITSRPACISIAKKRTDRRQTDRAAHEQRQQQEKPPGAGR
jgi:hypothetical protein